MAATKAAKYTKELAEHFYETMCTIRKFEESVKHDFLNGEIPGFVHLYIGEEAIATGVCSALRKDDMIESTHRGHGHCVAKGADVNRMMAEIFGKKTGLCQGRGGSMHIADFSVGMLGANGVVGGGYNLATGAAMASKMILKNDRVSVVFFGDGASNQGTFHESINLAAVWKLPVIYVCENNQFGMTVPTWQSTSVENIADRAAGYADSVAKSLDSQGFRVEVDHRSEKIGKKIREAQLEKVPYMLVVGDRDMENQTVSLRLRSGEDQGAMSLADFEAIIAEDVRTKVIR